MLVMTSFVSNMVNTTFDSFFEEVDSLELCENENSEENKDQEDVLHSEYGNVNEMQLEVFTSSRYCFCSNFQTPELSELTPPPERA